MFKFIQPINPLWSEKVIIKFILYFIQNPFVELLLDLINILIILSIEMGPNEKYPYGKERIKNISALLPSIMFVYFGYEILSESITTYFLNEVVHTSLFSLQSTVVLIKFSDKRIEFNFLVDVLDEFNVSGE